MHVGLIIKDYAAGTEFNRDGLPTKSGAEFHAENHARELLRLGHQVTIFAKKRYFRMKSHENIDGIDLVRLHEPSRGAELVLRLMTTHRDVDALYIIGTPSFAVWAIRYAKRRGIPVTLALTIEEEVFRSEENWRNRIFAECSHYIATTHEIAEGFHTKGGIPAERITILPHGIDAKRFPTPAETERRKLREHLGIGMDTPVLLFLARVVLRKGVDTLQDIWRLVHVRCPQARLFVVGGGVENLLEQLRQLGTETDQSVIVTGEQKTPQDFYRMADVYIFPSRKEGLPTSVIEALSSGLPAVVSDIGGCDDLIENGFNGYRVPVEDAAAYAECVIELFENVELRRQMGENGRAFVASHLDDAVLSDKLASIIQHGKNVLGRHDFLKR